MSDLRVDVLCVELPEPQVKVEIEFRCPGMVDDSPCRHMYHWSLDTNNYPEGYEEDGCCGTKTHAVYNQKRNLVIVTARNRRDDKITGQWEVSPAKLIEVKDILNVPVPPTRPARPVRKVEGIV